MMLNFVKTGCQRKLTPWRKTMKVKRVMPVKLNAKIYNDLVKVFNNAACDPNLKLVRDQIIQMRKEFPTYAELQNAGVKFVCAPTFVYEDGTLGEVKSWIGSVSDPSDVNNTSILDASIVYAIDFVRGADPKSGDVIIALKIRGVPKGV